MGWFVIVVVFFFFFFFLSTMAWMIEGGREGRGGGRYGLVLVISRVVAVFGTVGTFGRGGNGSSGGAGVVETAVRVGDVGFALLGDGLLFDGCGVGFFGRVVVDSSAD